MKNALIAILTCLVTLLLIRGCNNNVRTKDSDTAQARQIEQLQQRLREQPTINIHDTINRIYTVYRSRIDTLERWDTNSGWHNISRLMASFGEDTSNTPRLQRLVGSRLIRGERDSALVVVYRAQWKIDSAAKEILTALDSLKTERISNLSSKVEKMQEKADKRQKRSKVIHVVSGVVGVIVLLLVK